MKYLMIPANDNNKNYNELFNFTKILISKIKQQENININNINGVFLEKLKIVK